MPLALRAGYPGPMARTRPLPGQRPRPEQYEDPFDYDAPGHGMSEYLEDVDAWKGQGDWKPASGGTEQPFTTRTGMRLQYMFQPRSGRHAYYDPDSDLIIEDPDELRLRYGMHPNSSRPPLPPPPRLGHVDASRRVARMIRETEADAERVLGRRENFDPEQDYGRETQSHHFALNKSSLYRLSTVDGEDVTLTFREFQQANDDGLSPDDMVEIMRMDIGETFRSGGGASPRWSIRRIR